MRRALYLTSTTLLLGGAAHAMSTPTQLLADNRIASHGEALGGKAVLNLEYAYAGEGMTGTVGQAWDVNDGRYVDVGRVGPIDESDGFDGSVAWMRDMSGAVTPESGGDKLKLAINEAYRNANAWWRRDFGGARVVSLGVKSDGNQRFEALAVSPAGGKRFEAWFDSSTHLLARTVELQGFQTVTTFFSDYRPVDGYLVASRISIDDGTGPQYRQQETLNKAAFEPVRPASAYGPPSWTNTARIANAEGRTTVPFQLLNNHIYAQVKINGSGPFLCIFDTGGHDIVTPETAKTLAIGSQGQAPGTGAGEGVVDIGFAKNVTFQIGDLRFTDPTITVLPFEQGGVEGFDEQGMIGFEVFRRFVTVIDYGASTLTFIDPAKFDPRDSGTPVPFRFYDHLPQVEGEFEGHGGLFDIDTGSRSELDLTKPFVDANGLVASHPKGIVATDGWGVGGAARSYVTRAENLALGPVEVRGLVVGFSLQSKGAFSDPSYVGNVGSGLLKRFVVTFDYPRQVMYLKALPAPAPDTNVFDRSGMWVNATPTGFKVVDVTAGGAAGTAGLKVGDILTSVDGTPASAIALSEFRRQLRDRPVGTRMALTVVDGGQVREVTLTLKDQV